MQLTIPSRRRVARFVVAFYAATALLFFGFFSVMGIFGPVSPWTVYIAALWPSALMTHEIHAALLLIGLGAALVEPRVTGVGN